MKKRVLELIGSFHQGGSERQAVQLVKLLRDEGSFDVFLGCLDGAGVLREEVELLGLDEIPEFKLSSFYDANFLRQVRRCARFIKENKIEIVHTHDFYTNIFGMTAALAARVPLRIASKRETLSKTKKQFFLERQAFKFAHKITVNAAAVKIFLENKNVPAEKIVTIHNGLDLERLQPKTTDRTEICREIGLPDDENIKFVTLVANLHHAVKNQPMFLRAAQRVLREFPDAHFVLAGEGELKESLENLAKELQIFANTHFIGRYLKIAELLYISEIGVLSSDSEGFSNSILEYMAAGKPVVATDVGGAGEVIIENETGFLVAANDDKTMAGRLLTLLQNSEKGKNFGAKGHKIIEENFSTAAQLSKVLELYNNSKQK